MATRAVPTDADHDFFKTNLAFAAPVPNDEFTGIVFRLKAGYKSGGMAAGGTQRPFDAVRMPESF